MVRSTIKQTKLIVKQLLEVLEENQNRMEDLEDQGKENSAAGEKLQDQIFDIDSAIDSLCSALGVDREVFE